jgi:hypothetical protein
MTLPENPKANVTEVHQCAPQPVLSVRASVPVAELTSLQGDALRELWSYMQQHGIRPAGPPYVRYHTFGEAETDVEVGIPVAVAAGAVGEARVVVGELPGGTVQWIDPSEEPDPAAWPDPSTWRTQLIQPVT